MAWKALLCLALLAPGLLFGQAEYRVYSGHPRIFLEEGLLTRLERSVERQTPQWRRLAAALAEPGGLAERPFAQALAYQAAGDEGSGREAVTWALDAAGRGLDGPNELRMAAIVFDWCYPLLEEADRERLAAALASAAERATGGQGVERLRDGMLAAVAAAGEWDGYEKAIGRLLSRWEQEIKPKLDDGRLRASNAELAAALEVCHVVRGNLDRDLFKESLAAFSSLPLSRVHGYLPGAIESGEGRLRQPAVMPPGAAAEREALLARVTDLLLVGYDGASRDMQFLQGWIRNDSFSLKGPYGIPYELLWLNPYLPGLSPRSGPQLIHDPVGGTVFGRQGWEDGDLWLGYYGGKLRLIVDGESMEIPPGSRQAPIEFLGGAVVLADPPSRFDVRAKTDRLVSSPTVYLVGLKEGAYYDVRVDRSGWRERQAGRGGIVALHSDPEAKGPDIAYGRSINIRIRPAKGR